MERKIDGIDATIEYGKVKKKKMHNLIGEDLWKLGKERLSKRNVVEMRKEAVRRRAKKSRLKKCIISIIHKAKSTTSNTIVGVDKDGHLSSQQWVQTHTNNLNLKN